MPNVFFAIPVSPRRSDTQWTRLNDLLAMTLRSVLNQSSPDYAALVCGHERPDCLDSFDPEKVEFIQANFDRPASIEDGRRDKSRKRRSIAVEVRKRGGGYYMYLDGDDLVHRDLVATVVADDNKVGYTINRGYTLDFANKILAPIPGAWKKPFNAVCGSSGIVYMRPTDLPDNEYPESADKNLLFFNVRNHKVFEKFSEIGSKDLARLDFMAGIYTMNNEINLSNVLVRTEERQAELIAGIKKHAISGGELAQALDDFALNDLFA